MKPICQIYGLCVEQLENYPYRDCGYDYWALVEEKLREKPIYQDDRKRQDKLQDLRIDMARAILFEPYLEKLPHTLASVPKSKKAQSDALIEASLAAAARKQKKDLKESFKPCLMFVFSKEEGTETNEETGSKRKSRAKTVVKGTIVVRDLTVAEPAEPAKPSADFWTHTLVMAPKLTKAMFYAHLLEVGIRHFLLQDAWKHRMTEEGIVLCIDYAPARTALNKAVKMVMESKCHYDIMDSVADTMDIGKLTEFNEINQFRQVATYLDKIRFEVKKT